MRPWAVQLRVPRYPDPAGTTWPVGRSRHSRGPAGGRASTRQDTRRREGRHQDFHWDSHLGAAAACTALQKAGAHSQDIQGHPKRDAVNVVMCQSHGHYRTHCAPMVRPAAAWRRYRNGDIGLLVS